MESEKDFLIELLNKLADAPAGSFYFAAKPPNPNEDLAAVQPWGRFSIAVDDGVLMKIWSQNRFEILELNRGDVIIMPELTFCKGVAQPRNCCAVSLILRDNHLRIVYSRGQTVSLVQYYVEDSLHASTIHAMTAFVNIGSAGLPLEMQQEYYRLLLRMVTNDIRKDEPKKYDKSYYTWLNAVEYIERRYDQSITRRQIGEFLKVSDSYLSKLFRRYAGTTVNDFQMRIRMAKAVELLKDPSLTVGEISYRCGFQTTSFFIKKFRRCYNATPARYRTRT